ncbi:MULTISPECIES: ABC transporter substrate-binding protein [Oceanotoga]|jgi:sn-glycerol 3-phosphate transport system substrate-binding protein|uniref:ABC transporter substrate-binding protein n=1 Tax=Oceanotoga TaxID=1255275 RepID=UPI002654F27B|nr:MULTISPECIES: ABC transporter substrate-binding protein [Oceanotoga]MDN5343133.1 sn-glycerol 3-phosphate transport system substrate-binding protein [Oceanotoga sp.]MDO7976154.1 ABC transporter substrate-binding protein [Oceanotoga teriensis]
MKKLFIVFIVLFSLSIFGKTTVDFWHAMSGERIQIIQSIADRFMEENPDIEVKTQYTGSYKETLNKLIAGVKSGTAPQIVQVYEIGTRSMIDGGIIIPIQDMIDKDKTFDEAVFLNSVLNYYRVDGKLYSMPFNSSNAVLFYNKTLFKEAGLDPNKPPKTFEEVMEYSKKLLKKDSNGNIIRTGLTWPTHSWIFEQLLAAQDAPLVDNDNGRSKRAEKAVFNNEEGQKIFKFFYDMTKNDLMLNTKKEDWSAARQIFLSGKAAMVMFSTSDVTSFTKEGKANGYDIGTAFLPTPDGAPDGGAIIGGASLWLVDGHSKEKTDAAWKFLKYLNSTEEQIKWHLDTGYFPVRKDAVENLMYEGFYSENPNYLTTIMQLVLSKQTYNTNGALIGVFPEARDKIETAIQMMNSDEMDYKKALKWAEDEVTKLIKEYNELYY